jgi:hypothetical protein
LSRMTSRTWSRSSLGNVYIVIGWLMDSADHSVRVGKMILFFAGGYTEVFLRSSWIWVDLQKFSVDW